MANTFAEGVTSGSGAGGNYVGKQPKTRKLSG